MYCQLTSIRSRAHRRQWPRAHQVVNPALTPVFPPSLSDVITVQ